MNIVTQYFANYIFFLGVFLLFLAIIEFIIPFKILQLWKSWVAHKFFPVHGMILIVGGFPITQFRDTISGIIMMIVGVIVILSGPFVLLFPDRVRYFFNITINELDREERKHLVYLDAIIRFIVAALFLFVILSRT